MIEFLSPEAGQRRRAWLEAQAQKPFNVLREYLGGTGVPERVEAAVQLADYLNPVSDIGRAGQSARVVADPNATGRERFNAGVSAVTDMASVLAPAAAVKAAGGDGARAVVEALANVTMPADDAVRRFAASEAGSAGADPIAARGDEILRLVKTDPKSVTDDMLDLGDPVQNARLNEYLFNNYDLPMDEASRMARAREMGFYLDFPLYHGTDSKFSAFDKSKQKDPGFWFTSDMRNAANYASADGDLLKVFTKSGNNTDVVFDYANGEMVPTVNGEAIWDIDNVGLVKEFLRRDGSVTFPTGNYSESGYTKVVENPAHIRLTSARFDPRLAHLRNLSAGIGGAAILSDYMTPDQREQELRAYLGL